MTDHTPHSGGTGDDEVEYHDAELGARLNAEGAPEHRPDFWANLQTELNAEAAMRNGSFPATGPTALADNPDVPPGNPDVSSDNPDVSSDNTVQMPVQAEADQTSVLYGEPTSERATNVASLAEHRSRSGAALWLSAAAALLVIGVGAAVLLNRDNSGDFIEADVADSSEVDGEAESTDQNVSPDDTAEPDDTSAPDDTDDSAQDDVPAAEDDLPLLPADYFGPSTTTTIGDGRFVGFSPDESAVLLLLDTTTGQTGCEGAPLLELFSQDLATGVRVPALPAGMTVETGGLQMLLADQSGAAGTVYLADFCDGFRSTVWEATMAANGDVSDLVELNVEEGSPADPFAEQPSDPRAAGAVAVSPDGSFAVYNEPGWLVQRLDGSAEQWNAPPEVQATGAVWDPTSQVLFLSSTNVVWIWNFRTDERAPLAADSSWLTALNRSGTQLVRNPFDEVGFGAAITITTFGDEAVPAQAQATPVPEPTCSGAVDLAVLDQDTLAAAGLPNAVAQTVAEIDVAAAACDWDRLGELLGPAFTASFGGGDAIELWQQSEQANGVMDDLRAILHQPFAAQSNGADDAYVWPAVFTAESCQSFTDADRQSLAELGYSDDDIAADCDFADGYVGYRTAIDASGQWMFFVAGD